MILIFILSVGKLSTGYMVLSLKLVNTGHMGYGFSSEKPLYKISQLFIEPNPFKYHDKLSSND